MKFHLDLYFVFVLAGIVSCNQTVNEPSVKVSTVTVDPAEINDSLIIYRNQTPDFNHIVYVEKDTNCQYYKTLLNFEFSGNDKEYYESTYLPSYKVKEQIHSNKIDLPSNWLPVYLYKSDFYLYYPSDMGNSGRLIINDTAVVFFGLEGPYPSKIYHSDLSDSKNIKLLIKDPLALHPSKSTLSVLKVNNEKGIYMFSLFDEKNYEDIRFMIPAENAKAFKMIVNYCEEQRQEEYKFDEDIKDYLKKYLPRK